MYTQVERDGLLKLLEQIKVTCDLAVQSIAEGDASETGRRINYIELLYRDLVRSFVKSTPRLRNSAARNNKK